LDAGVNINVQSNSYERLSALHICAEENKIALAEAILQKKSANVDIRDIYKRTPLHLAVIDGRVEIVELLVAAGADVNAKNNVGETPIDYAKFNKKEKQLLEALGV
jgi:ankyrin repeat protein